MPAAASPSALVVIPARYGSTRFPGKPLALIAGRPMILHVLERARRAQGASQVIVATDDERIARAVTQAGGQAVLTRPDHRCGTERVAEVAAHRQAEIYLNVQGDEPLLDPAALDALIAGMLEDPEVRIATLAVPLRQAAEIMDPNVTKLVASFSDDALYFSRAPIPWVRDTQAGVPARHLKHIGIYGFRRETLLEFPTLPPGQLERTEQLEQLRWLENGYSIRVFEHTYDAVSVDLPADILRVERLLQQQAAT